MKTKYPSKVSYGLLLFIFVIFFAPFLVNGSTTEWSQTVIIALAFMIVLYVFILYIFMQTVYTIANKTLNIRMGFITFRAIKIDEIKKISKTNSVFSSPAPSFDRIEIEHGEFGSVIISPKDKTSLSKALEQLNPKIENRLEES